MDGAKGSALEWALALLRAPGERHVLRQKPLPGGIERLLGIAAGTMPDALAEAARTFAEPEPRVREAAQFYAREVLFFPQADAYRVLGVDAHAPPERIKAHHRLLQHWLHPDRLHSEDDAVFAARVNSAWNHLRSPDRRRAYDEARRQSRPPEVFDSSGALRSVPAWVPEPDLADVDRWRHRLPVLALSAACLLLVLLIVRDMGRRPQAWDLAERRKSASAETDAGIGIEVPRLGTPDRPSRPPDNRAERKPRPSNAATMPRVPKAADKRAPAAPAVVALPAPVPNPAPLPVPLSAQPTIAVSEAITAAPAMPEAHLAVAEPARPPPPQRPAPAAEATPSFARIQSARQTGDQLLRYMGAVDRSPPPIWNSPAIQSSAEQMRHELHDQGRARFSAAQWRIGNQTAMLISGYKVEQTDAETGMVTADLVWREGRWLVTGVSMERAP